MAQVDFYILGHARPGGREHLACRLAEKAWRSGYCVFIRTANDGIASELDRLLWTYRDGSFVPHALATGADPLDPILIGSMDEAPPDRCDLLINLANAPPDSCDRWQRIAEIADQEPESIAGARSRFRWYRDQGLKPDSHQLE